MNLYKLLDITESASDSQIKNAYHKLVSQNDPNKGNENTTTFRNVIFAYSILSNKNTKFVYDIIGPDCAKMLGSEMSKNILCSVINPTNVFLMSLFLFMIAISFVTTVFFFYLMVVEDVFLFMSNVLVNLIVHLFIIDLTLVRILVRMKRYNIKLPNKLIFFIIGIQCIVVLQLLLLFLKIDFRININIFLLCLPSTIADFTISSTICFTRRIPVFLFLIPFLLRQLILLFWMYELPKILKVIIVLIIPVQYAGMNLFSIPTLLLISGLFVFFISPYVMIDYNIMEWYTFIPIFIVLIGIVVFFIVLKFLAKKRHFYKRLIVKINATNLLYK